MNNYKVILSDLKEKIRQARFQAAMTLNGQLLTIYWEIGNTILDQQKNEGWGTKVIERLSRDLKADFPEMKGLSMRNLKYMRSFAEAYPQFVQRPVSYYNEPDLQTDKLMQVPLAQNTGSVDKIIVQAELAQLSWYHHITLLDKIKGPLIRTFYLILCKTKDGLVAEYALRDSRKPIGIAEYTINKKLPSTIRRELPSIKELESAMEEN